MGRYVTQTVEVDVEVDLSYFDDGEIRDEAEHRGLLDNEKDGDRELNHIKWEWNHGSKKEALILLEKYLELSGLSQLNF
jgi:hypothetical protein